MLFFGQTPFMSFSRLKQNVHPVLRSFVTTKHIHFCKFKEICIHLKSNHQNKTFCDSFNNDVNSIQ